jgi:hypothetical protein
MARLDPDVRCLDATTAPAHERLTCPGGIRLRLAALDAATAVFKAQPEILTATEEDRPRHTG